MIARSTGLLVSLLLGLAGLATPTAAALPDRDCGDFASQAEAQRFFLDNNPSADPHGLDGEGDGIACESLPCPCLTSGGGGGGGAGPVPFTPAIPEVKREHARVLRVVDGDTILVRLRSGPTEYVRLLGIDTPEVYGGRECGGEEASSAAKVMLPEGTKVQLTSDPTQDLRDRYDRLLRYVSKGQMDVNRKLVVRGLAAVYVYQDNPFQRTQSYRKAQGYAKRADLGVWGSC